MEVEVQRLRVAPTYTWMVTVVPPLFIAIAAMVGLGLKVDNDWMEAHWHTGEGVAIVAILVLTPLAFLAGFPKRLRIAPLTVVMVVLWMVQAGLGHGSEDTPWLIALHIPNALLIFGLGLTLAFLSHRALREARAG